METFTTDIVVIGAGAVGLAIAQVLARKGRDVLVLEAETAFGTQTSSRNSEVIHAGLYYRTGSLKARLCVEGRRALYAFCASHHIAVRKCGKLVIAVGEDEGAKLEALADQAKANDVEEIEILTPSQALEKEPALNPHMSGALYSGTTGIFDSHGYMLSLTGLLEDSGGQIAYNSRVTGGQVTPDGVELLVEGDLPMKLIAGLVINAAGHGAIPVAGAISGPHQRDLPVNRFVKGSYFSITGRTPFTHLIYPMHTEASLGLHLTVDLQGQGKLGPDAEWLPESAKPPFDYQVQPAHAEKFYASARRYWPGLPDGALAPGYAGVRPKIVGPGEPSGDFLIEGPDTHGSKGLINLLGIESPGLTSSLAIADHVLEIVEKIG